NTPTDTWKKQKRMYLQRMIHSHNATSHLNYNEEVLSKGLASPRATLKQTIAEKKLNSMEKTARPVKENPVDLEPTSFQMQQLQAHGFQAFTRMDDPKMRLKNKNETSQEEVARDANEWHEDWTS
ncbi:1174_t:CDS:2, partial [Acaulospora colombiana]